MALSPEQIHLNLPNIHRQKILYGKIKWWTDSSGAADNRSSFVYAKTWRCKNFNYHPQLLQKWNAGGISGQNISYSWFD